MGWEKRGNKQVYYRKERYVDGSNRMRVRSIYCGSGERGEAAEREDIERRSTRGNPPREKSESAPAIVKEPPISAEEIMRRGTAELMPEANLRVRTSLLKMYVGEGRYAEACELAHISEEEVSRRGFEAEKPITLAELQGRASRRGAAPTAVSYWVERGNTECALLAAGVSKEEAERRGLCSTTGLPNLGHEKKIDDLADLRARFPGFKEKTLRYIKTLLDSPAIKR